MAYLNNFFVQEQKVVDTYHMDLMVGYLALLPANINHTGSHFLMLNFGYCLGSP